MVESPSPPPPPSSSPPPPAMPLETLDRRDTPSPPNPNPNHHRERRNSLSPSASPPPHSPPPRRRDRYPRERKDFDRDFDHRPPPPNRYYDRNRDRDRDYRDRDYHDRGFKRRFSSSPPPPNPPPYRDNRRRFSPPYPPPFKRRRDDGGGYFNGRRRSPRGGYGYGYGGDRRFGNRFRGGYERDMGGRGGRGSRGGYAGDWPRGRYRPGGYEGGPFDWNASNNSFGDSSNAANFQREGLMTYKQFIQELEDDVLPSEAEHRYQEYKSEYISTLKRTYFEAHKDEEWLRNKYHPTNLLSVIERRNERARKAAKDILLDLHTGTVDLGPGVHVSFTNKSGQTSEPNSDDETDVNGKRRRHGWVQVNEADLLAAPKAPTVSSEPRRIQIDSEQAQAVIAKLDLEKGIEDNILSTDNTDNVDGERPRGGSIGPVIIIRGLTSVKGLEGVELLDTLLTYLWRVHGVDYYGMVETEEPKGLRHIRSEGKGSDISRNAVEWEKKLDLHWQDRLRSQDPLEIMTAKEKIDAAAVEALEPSVRKIRDEKYGWKYGCGAKGCTKLFHAPEFVHKHLKLKHPDLVMELTSKVREDIYFQNYMNDPDAPGGQPVMQQYVPKDKMQRRRPEPDNHSMDDHGPQSDRDRNGSERFERQENPPADFTSNKDAADKGNLDKPVFDNFAGQGVSVAPFAPDMAPPQLLMPVPGAGPLGPFVPAPPEVAMQMLRKQGGPVLDGSGRSGLPGAPIILPPTLPQDPRRLRSYRDLDAPEDEVTVMDYRSL